MSLSDKKRRACEEISAWLKEADIQAGNTINSDDFYFSEAEKRIKGFRWQLYKLNRPFVWLEKKVIEPLDFWSERANVFQFFAKISPVIQAIGVLAIPFMLLIYENQRNEQQLKIEDQREKRQLEFQQNVIESQAEVRQQQAIRDYLSQITTIYLDVENRDEIAQDKDLKNLLEATTLAIFDELSVSETFQNKSKDDDVFNDDPLWRSMKISEKDRKGNVINFLSKLGWINRKNEKEQLLISLSRANLRRANLSDADLRGANLSYANLKEAELGYADLRGADLSYANLRGANLLGADLRGVNLSHANLKKADLAIAKLSGAIFCNTTMPNGDPNNDNCE